MDPLTEEFHVLLWMPYAQCCVVRIKLNPYAHVRNPYLENRESLKI